MSQALQEAQPAIANLAPAFEDLQSGLEQAAPALQSMSAPMQQVAEHAQTVQKNVAAANESIAQMGASLPDIVQMPPIVTPEAASGAKDLATGLEQAATQAAIVADNVDMASQKLGTGAATWRDQFGLPSDFVLQFDKNGQIIGAGADIIGQQLADLARQNQTTANSFNDLNTAAQNAAPSVAQFATSPPLGTNGPILYPGGPLAGQPYPGPGAPGTLAGSSGLVEDPALAQLKQAAVDTWGQTTFPGLIGLTYGEGLIGPPAPEPGLLASLGEGFGSAATDLGNVAMAASQFAMPLMALSMVAQMIGQVGSAIYNMAQLAEGPAAHSVGTFTGAVDSLGNSFQQSGKQFSESFGQQMVPTLDAMNSIVSQNDTSGGLGGFLGQTVGFISNIGQIILGLTTMPMPVVNTEMGWPMMQSGLRGLINQGASLLGQPEPYPGPQNIGTPAQQYLMTQLGQMPQTVDMSAAQLDTQAFQQLAQSADPGYLQAMLDNQAAQRIAQQRTLNYLATHGPPSLDQLQQRQYYESQGFSPDEIDYINKSVQSGYWAPSPWSNEGGPGPLINPTGGVGSTAYGPPSGLGTGGGFDLGKFFGGIGSGFSQTGDIFDRIGIGGIGSFVGGIGQGLGSLWKGLLDFFSQPMPDMSGLGAAGRPQCFPAGTRVLMADGTERGIEVLHIGNRILAYDGKEQVPATVVTLIRPPRKMVYELVFDNGNTLRLTDAHPVATTAGWKSLAPAASMREIPGLEVTLFQRGDTIITASGTCTLIDWYPVEIMKVYNITVDGPHTFFANGILVHNKVLAQQASEDIGSQIADMLAGIKLPPINLSSIGTDLAGAFSNIPLPHIDLTPLTSGLASVFSNLPHIDLSGLTGMWNGISSQISGIFSQLPQVNFSSLMSLGQEIGSGINSLFTSISNFHMPQLDFSSLMSIGEGISSAFSSMVAGIRPPDFGSLFGAFESGIAQFSTIKPPSFSDIIGTVNNWLSSFNNIHFPSLPDIGGWVSNALSSMFSGISSVLSMPGIPLYASGVQGAPPGLAVVGENGPELLMMAGGESIYPMSALSGGGAFPGLGSMFGGDSGQATIYLTNITTLDGRIVAQQTIPYIAPLMRLASGSRR